MLRIDLSSSAAKNARSSADSKQQEAIEAFQKSIPSLHIEYKDSISGNVVHSDTAVQAQLQWVWAQGDEAAELPARGWWQIAFRPDPEQLTATTLAHAFVRIAGGNTVVSAPFEVRTKPSEWVLVTGLPSASSSQATLAALLSACAVHGTAKVVQGLDIKQVVAVTGSSSALFVKLKSRAQAGAVVLGAHALRASAQAGAAAHAQAQVLRSVFAAPCGDMQQSAFPASSAWSPAGATLVSHIPSMNTASKEDPSLVSIPVPTDSERTNIRTTSQGGQASAAGNLPPVVPKLEGPLESPAALARRPSEDTASEPDAQLSAERTESYEASSVSLGASESADEHDWDVASSDGYWNALAQRLGTQAAADCDSDGDEDLILPAAVEPVLCMDLLPQLPTASAACQQTGRGTKRGRNNDPTGQSVAAPQARSKRRAVLEGLHLHDLPTVEDVLSSCVAGAAQFDGSLPWFLQGDF